jgi:glucose/arabinose dehydrogenase/PKD repeat protein
MLARPVQNRLPRQQKEPAMCRTAFLCVLTLAVGEVVWAAVPAGFEDLLVATIAAPTALAFTPDGRLLVTTQPGQLRVISEGTLLPTPALDLASKICTNSERGVLGVAVDPAFATNGYIYLYYTFNTGTCAQNAANTPVNRVSRFTLGSNNIVSASSELILIDRIPSVNGNHNGGDLQFGRDGHLYVSVGDSGCDYRFDSGCAGSNDSARDRNVLVGKILRITPTGGIPPGNPFIGAGTVRCNAGTAQPGQVCQEIFAWGFRNPFRIAFDPNASGTRFYINDVGQNTWEEINEAIAGADYGWNVREGNCVRFSVTDCGPPPAGMTNPIYAYPHNGDGCQAITGGAFVPAAVWPAPYSGAYLFADYTCGTIFRLVPGTGGTFTRAAFATNLGASSAVAMIFGPFNGTRALYYTSYAGGGEVRRISAVSGNRSPVAAIAAAPSSGPLPLTVRFNGGGSSDPDNDPLTYEWAFGDGAPAATGVIVSHTYSTAGTYTARLTVRDGRGGTGTNTVLIHAGNTAPTATITSPSSADTFAVGQPITLRGGASDNQDGPLADSRLSWTVLLHHNTHTHPYFGPSTGNGLTFQAPAPEDLEATTSSFLEVILTATDSQGAATTVRRNVQPRRVSVTLQSTPSNLGLNVNAADIVTPATVTSWEGYRLTVTAPTQRDAAGQTWVFGSWSDGGAATHTIVTPAAAATYTATFTTANTLTPAADAYVRNGAYQTQNFGNVPWLYAKHSSAIDNQRQSFLRFTVGASTVSRAVLRLYGGLSSAGSIPVPVYPVASTTWSETSLTWATRPARGSTALATRTIASTAKTWHEWDVTSYVRAERAAGRTAVSFVVPGTVTSTPYAEFASREAAANRPELVIDGGGGGSIPTTDNIVLYATDASRFTGTWRLVADSTAAAGMRIHNPDAAAAKPAAALASPANYAEWSFNAEAGRPYRLWMRGKADRNFYGNDSVFIQFSGSVTSTGAATWRIGTTSSTIYVLEECSGCVVSGWGWQDNGYGAGVLGPVVYFATTGPQTIRIQVREDGLSIDQIVLSPTTYLNASPGTVRNDATIVGKP